MEVLVNARAEDGQGTSYTMAAEGGPVDRKSTRKKKTICFPFRPMGESRQVGLVVEAFPSGSLKIHFMTSFEISLCTWGVFRCSEVAFDGFSGPERSYMLLSSQTRPARPFVCIIIYNGKFPPSPPPPPPPPPRRQKQEKEKVRRHSVLMCN